MSTTIVISKVSGTTQVILNNGVVDFGRVGVSQLNQAASYSTQQFGQHAVTTIATSASAYDKVSVATDAYGLGVSYTVLGLNLSPKNINDAARNTTGFVGGLTVGTLLSPFAGTGVGAIVPVAGGYGADKFINLVWDALITPIVVTKYGDSLTKNGADYSNEHRRTPSPISSNAPVNAAAKVAVQTHAQLSAPTSTSASSAASNAARAAADKAFEADWAAAQNAHKSTGSSYSRNPADYSYLGPTSDNYGAFGESPTDSSSSSSSDFGQSLSDAFNSDGYDGFWPIVIDLDGDGVELRPLSSSATFFDTDSDNYQERTAWAGADDGILVIDLDGDGQVTQAKEIAFAEWTEEQDSDLQALAKVFDSNQDGVFDSQDERFAEFRIWRDANSNGVVDAGEMMTLQEAGIQSMGLKTKDGTALDLSDVCAANDRLFCLRA